MNVLKDFEASMLSMFVHACVLISGIISNINGIFRNTWKGNNIFYLSHTSHLFLRSPQIWRY